VSDQPGTLDPEHAFDPEKQDALAEAIKRLSPQEAAYFLWKMEVALRKRKLQLSGYLVAIGVWLVGMVSALVIYGTTTGFVGWVFFVPFGLVGLVLWGFGTWADRIGAQKPPPEIQVTSPKSA
jgi:hypothetical protein